MKKREKIGKLKKMGGDEGIILVLQNKSLKKKGLTNKETILVNLEFPFIELLNIRQPRNHITNTN